MKRVASPGSMHDAGCLGLVHWEDPEGWNGEGGGRRVQDGEHMCTCGGFILIFFLTIFDWVVCFDIGLHAAAKLLQSGPILCNPMDCSLARLLYPWDFPGRNTGVGCHFLFFCF